MSLSNSVVKTKNDNLTPLSQIHTHPQRMDDILDKIPSAMPSMLKLGWKVTNLNIGDNDSSLMRRGREQGPFMKLETAEGDSIVLRPPQVNSDSKGSSTKGSYDHRQVCEYTSPGVVRSEIENLIALIHFPPVVFDAYAMNGVLDRIQSGIPHLSRSGWKVFSISREYMLLVRGSIQVKIYCADKKQRAFPTQLFASGPQNEVFAEICWLDALASRQSK